MDKVRIKIDGKEFEVEKGKTILEVALENGIKIPYFCYHPRLSIAGACRMCIVYVENYKRLLIACNTKVEDGLEVYTQHELVKENQSYILQALMTRHPLDCPICDKAGECDLQNHGALYGPQEQIVPISALDKYRDYTDWESDFLEYYSNRCIVCYRCTRVCDEIIGAKALFVDERGFHSNIVPAVRPLDTSSCEMCGACVYVCPVGAILSKPFKFWSRSWLLDSVVTNCSFCSIGCDIRVEFGRGDWKSKEQVYRIKPTDNINVCAKAFFGYDVFNKNRLLKPVRDGEEITYEEAIEEVIEILKSEGKIGIVLSPYLPNEVLNTVIDIAEKIGAVITSPMVDDFMELYNKLENNKTITLNDLEEYDNFIILSKDITSLAPTLSYYIEGSIYKIFEYKNSRDEKLNYSLLEWKDIEKLKGNTLIIIDPITCGEYGERAIKEFKDTENIDILLVPRDFNTIGLSELLKDVEFTSFRDFLGSLKAGDFSTLVLFGEDITDYLEDQSVAELLGKAEKIIVSSPFDDGLSQKAYLSLPMNLFGEMEGSVRTLMGLINLENFLPWSFEQRKFWEEINNALEGSIGIQKVKGERFETKVPEIHIYRSNWITKKSILLGKLYEKVSSVSV